MIMQCMPDETLFSLQLSERREKFPSGKKSLLSGKLLFSERQKGGKIPTV